MSGRQLGAAALVELELLNDDRRRLEDERREFRREDET